MLIPRMTITQRNAILSPATGLLIYQTNNTPGFITIVALHGQLYLLKGQYIIVKPGNHCHQQQPVGGRRFGVRSWICNTQVEEPLHR